MLALLLQKKKKRGNSGNRQSIELKRHLVDMSNKACIKTGCAGSRSYLRGSMAPDGRWVGEYVRNVGDHDEL